MRWVEFILGGKIDHTEPPSVIFTLWPPACPSEGVWMWADWKPLTFCSHLSSQWTGTRLDCFGMSGCDLYLEKESEGDRRRDKETARCLILPALFSAVRLGRRRVCRRSRGPTRCTDSSARLSLAARCWPHGAFTGQRVDTDEDYI